MTPGSILRLRRTALVAALVLPGVLFLATPPVDAAVTECAPFPLGDFNGDGFPDAVVGEADGGATRGGRVHVFYGTAAGLTFTGSGDAPDDQVFAQGIGGVPGVDAAGDRFGAATQVADLNRDGCADLAIGAPGNNRATGSVTVLYGSPGAGLTTAGAQFLTQDSVTPGSGRAGEAFGASLATAELDGDGIVDLVVGAPFDTGTAGAGADRGAVTVFYDWMTGVGRAARADVTLTQDAAIVPGVSENGDAFGYSLATGDVTHDGIDDIVVGVPGENGYGVVDVLLGTLDGGLRVGPDYSQNTAGVPGTAEVGDAFGQTVAVGDVTGDATADIVVGAPGENSGAGAVTVVHSGSTSGPVRATGAQMITQDTAGVQGVAGAGDAFGFSLAVVELNQDGTKDLVVGTPGDAIGAIRNAGSVSLLYGGPSGLVVLNGERLSQDWLGVAGTPEPGDAFGFSVQPLAVDGQFRDDFLVGAPGETLGTTTEAGLVHRFLDGVGGGRPSVTLEADTPNVAGGRTSRGHWGYSLG
ncbi:FG-GAP repeat protein [Kineosporia sp. R_H_3]|uniref:FG-GAP repeat protein n=1 Tax=Kineosporia sp. R_H_3 TaxID=1961848 RepID=UPI000B4B9732|nr:FG-GAP repeat protein [Kineosporia sp. R_H_3]